MRSKAHTPRSTARRIVGSLAVGLISFAMTAPAMALPPGGGTGEPPIGFDPPDDFTIRGSVSVACPTTPDKVTITAVGTGLHNRGVVRTVKPSGPVLTGEYTLGSMAAGAGMELIRPWPTASWQYSIGGLERGPYTVTPKLASGVCPYGTWDPAQRTQVGPASTADNPIRLGISFAYAPPSKVTRVPAPLVASWLNGALSGMRIHLDNYGPQHGQSHHEPNASYLAMGSTTLPFTIPDFQYDIDCGILCPDLGQARFYVNDVNSQSIGVGWASSAFAVDVAFESAGREIKGYFTDGTTGIVADDLMPDVQVDNAHVKMRLVPVVDTAGGLTYSLQQGPDFSGSIQATGPCSVFGYDACDWITDYKSKLTSSVRSNLGAVLTSSTARAAVGDALKPLLASAGISTVKALFVEGDTIVITS
jgi:hypothetical protein